MEKELKNFIENLEKDSKNYSEMAEKNKESFLQNYYDGLSVAYHVIANKLEKVINNQI